MQNIEGATAKNMAIFQQPSAQSENPLAVPATPQTNLGSFGNMGPIIYIQNSTNLPNFKTPASYYTNT
jgi:hypothetical protein